MTPVKKMSLTGRHTVVANLLFAVMPASYAAEYSELPAPISQPAAQMEYTLYLTLEVNGRNDGQIVPVKVINQHYWLPVAVLSRNFIRLPAGSAGLIDSQALNEVTTEYDSVQQKLKFRVPDSWLPRQTFRNDGLLDYSAPQSSTGLLLNYDVYSLKASGNSSYTALWLEQRLFGPAGMFTNSGTWRQNWSGNSSSATRDRYLRYDTRWKYSDVDNLISYQLGDVISDSLSWSNSVRLGGVRISRNFSVRPDLVTYPLLNWSGTAAVPGSVDLFINGYKSSSNSLNAGPWTLTNVPYINGAGEATVVTTDALGRQVSTSIPFYVSNQLLRAGLSDFDFSLGALRRNYGSASADYDAASVSGLWRYGLTDSLSLSGHAEGREGLATGGVGADIAVGLLGTLSTSVSHASADGQQLSLGYSYYGRRFSLSAQHLQRSRGYSDLSVYDTSATLSRRTDQLTLSTTPFGQHGGSLGMGYFDIEAQDGTRTRLVNLSWSRSLWNSSSLYLALNKTLGSNNTTALAQLVIPLGDAGTASASIQRDSTGDLSERLSYSRAAPANGGLGWNIGLSAGNSQYRQADVTWKNPYSVLSGGFYGESGAQNSWLDMTGSLIVMDGALFITNKIDDAFIVVSTDGYPDIPVSYENLLVGSTDAGGHLLVPWASAWYPAKLSIDTLSLPATVSTANVEKRVAVREGSGALVTFPIQKERSALIRLVDEHNQPLPPGTLVTETISGQTVAMGYEGLAWFSHLTTKNEIIVSLATGNCHHTFPLVEDSDIATRIGPLVCSTHKPKDDAS